MQPEEADALKELKAKSRRFRELFNSERGQQVLADLKAHFGDGGPSLDAAALAAPLDGISKAMISQRNDGQRDVLRYIEHQMVVKIQTTDNTEDESDNHE